MNCLRESSVEPCRSRSRTTSRLASRFWLLTSWRERHVSRLSWREKERECVCVCVCRHKGYGMKLKELQVLGVALVPYTCKWRGSVRKSAMVPESLSLSLPRQQHGRPSGGLPPGQTGKEPGIGPSGRRGAGPGIAAEGRRNMKGGGKTKWYPFLTLVKALTQHATEEIRMSESSHVHNTATFQSEDPFQAVQFWHTSSSRSVA